MQKDNNNISELHSMSVITFILEQFEKENVDRNMEVCAELILISRLLMQRFKKRFGLKVKENDLVEKAKLEIIEEMKKDESYESLIYLIKNYRQFKEKPKLNYKIDKNKKIKISPLNDELIEAIDVEVWSPEQPEWFVDWFSNKSDSESELSLEQINWI